MRELPLLSTWKVLKEVIGIPWEKTHVRRLEDPKKYKDPFPPRNALGEGRRPTREIRPTFAAFVMLYDRYYRGPHLTIAEFRHIDLKDIRLYAKPLK